MERRPRTALRRAVAARLESLEPRVHLSVTRPDYNTGTGFFVTNGQVYDANGEPFVIRGVNQNHWWGNPAENFAAIDHVAKTGSNAVRAVFNKDLPGIVTQSGSDTPAERRAIVEEILANHMVPIVEDHAVTNETYVNDPNGLHQVVTNWLDPANVSWLQQYERQVILNIANEWGPAQSGSNHVWRESYITQVQRLRAANIDNLIMIDAGGWGQDPNTIRNDAQAVLDADPQHNIVFSSHFYSNWRTEDRAFDVTANGPYDVLTYLTQVKNAGLPIVVGEFSWESLDFATYRTRRVMEICQQLGIGYMGWGWNHNSPTGLNMLVDAPGGSVDYQYNSNTDLTAWGDLTVNDPQVGIKATAVRASIFAAPESPRLILEKTTVVVPETGQAVARVRLSKAPAADVTASLSKLSGDANVTLAGATALTFTPGNWSQYQTILLSAASDADTAAGTAKFALAGGGLQTVDFVARELDSGIPAGSFTLTPTHDRDTQSDSAAGTNASVSASRFNTIYMKYDLSGVGGRVTNAVLRINKTQSTSNLTGRVWVSLDDNWTQSTAPASLPGLAYPVLSQVMPNAAGFVEFNITSLIDGEVLGDRTVTIGITTNSNNWTAFNTKEAAAAVRPQLVVTSVAMVPPQIAGVFVAGSTWSTSFLNHLQSTGQGDATYGFAINPAAATDELPWTNLNKVSVRFSANVNVAQNSLAIAGVNVANYATTAFAYDAATFTATWMLDTAGLGADKLRLSLTGVTDAVTGMPMNLPAAVRLDVLPGDVNRSGGTVNAGDVTQVRNRQFTDTANPGAAPNAYSVFHDVNGNGLINAQDVTLTRNRQFLGLPEGEPPLALQVFGILGSQASRLNGTRSKLRTELE